MTARAGGWLESEIDDWLEQRQIDLGQTQIATIDIQAEARRRDDQNPGTLACPIPCRTPPLGRCCRWHTIVATLLRWARVFGTYATILTALCCHPAWEVSLQYSNTIVVWEHQQVAQSADLGDLLVRVIQGYSEHTPNGFHLFYHVDSTVAGNTKLACQADKKALIETRGEGDIDHVFCVDCFIVGGARPCRCAARHSTHGGGQLVFTDYCRFGRAQIDL